MQIEIDRSLRYGYPLSLMIADVDLFKKFNDAHGHSAGDEALAGVARVLLESVRSSDAVARIGGDEFAVILPETPLNRARGSTSLQSATESAERIESALRRPNASGLTLSIGIAELNAAEPTERRIFRDADEALYRAKAAGRQQFMVGADDPITANELEIEMLQSSNANTAEDAALSKSGCGKRSDIRPKCNQSSMFSARRRPSAWASWTAISEFSKSMIFSPG